MHATCSTSRTASCSTSGTFFSIAILYTEAFRAALERGGVKIVRLPARSPDLNAFAERFVLSVKSECLDRIVPLGERHLRRAASELVAHDHQERNHQGLENRLIDAAPEPANTNGRVARKERLSGLLSFYHRAAAREPSSPFRHRTGAARGGRPL